jgi:hypothetical protein
LFITLSDESKKKLKKLKGKEVENMKIKRKNARKAATTKERRKQRNKQ